MAQSHAKSSSNHNHVQKQDIIDLRSFSNGKPSAIVIGAGFAGLAAARELQKEFKVTVLESRDRIGGRVHTDRSFGFPVDLGASWIHGMSDANPIIPIIKQLRQPLYQTSEENSVLYDHDLESFALFDENGLQVDRATVSEVERTFELVLEETKVVRNEFEEDKSVAEAMARVFERRPELRSEGLAMAVLQWYICRFEGWFAADIDAISAQLWDMEALTEGGHGLLVNGYEPILQALSEGLDIRLNHRVSEIRWLRYGGVQVVTGDMGSFVADGAIITVPIGVLQAKRIMFNPSLPDWKQMAIDATGVGNENKVALLFEKPFWPNVEFLGIVAPTPYECSYFLNLHKATGNPVLVFMPAGSLAIDLETLPDEEVVEFVMSKLRCMFPKAPVKDPLQYRVTRWGTDEDSLGCYTYDKVGLSENNTEELGQSVGPLFFAGEATSDFMGTVHGAFSSGIRAAEECRSRCAEKYLALQLPLQTTTVSEIDKDKRTTKHLPPLMVSRLAVA